MKIVLLIFFITNFSYLHAQDNLISSKTVVGEVTEYISSNDSIFFNTGLIDKKYFQKDIVSAKIINNKFYIKNDFSYPQMFRVVFLEDKHKRIWRFGKYFIDGSTKLIKLSHQFEECSLIDNKNAKEFATKYLPFFFNTDSYDCKSMHLQDLSQDVKTSYDSTLLRYTQRNPDSYVALWNLIERYSLFGHSEIRQKTLDYFSENLKKERIWKILNDDLKKSKIKENQKFPNIKLKTSTYYFTDLVLPKAKFTLINYWFSRCKPCLEEIPALKKLYASYKLKGFEIVNISTDKTVDLPIWQKRIAENELTWLQYLDENGKEASSLSINRFPSTFLLNQNGEVIEKNISPKELELFLHKQFKDVP